MTPTLEEARELFAVAQRSGRRPARRPRRALQRRRGRAQADRDRADPHRVPPARAVRAARAEGHRGDGPHDPRHRHRAGAGGLAAACGSPPRGPRCTPRSPTWPPCRSGSPRGTMATITASRATEEKIRTLAITQPDAYIVLDYTEQDIQIHRRAAQEYTINRELASATGGPRSSSTSRSTATTRSSSRSSICSAPSAGAGAGEPVMLAAAGRPALARHGARDRADDPRRRRRGRPGATPPVLVRALPRSDVRRRRAAGAHGRRGATPGLARASRSRSPARAGLGGLRRRRRSRPALEAMGPVLAALAARAGRRGAVLRASSGWATSSARRRPDARSRDDGGAGRHAARRQHHAGAIVDDADAASASSSSTSARSSATGSAPAGCVVAARADRRRVGRRPARPRGRAR